MNTTRHSAQRALIAACLCAVAFGCDRFGCRGGHLAVLVSASGPVERDFASSVEQWKPAADRATFSVGDGLRTGEGASAKLELQPAGEVVVDSNTVVRFSATPGEAQTRVDVDIGSIELGSGSSELTLETVLGLVRIDRGSRVRVRGGDAGDRLEVTLGNMWLDRQGKRVEASAGEELLLDVGGITLAAARPTPEPESEVAAPNLPNEAPQEALEAPADAGVGGEGDAEDDDLPSGPLRAEVTIGAGESAVIHDPAPPTRVRVPFAATCTKGGVLEVLRGSRTYAKVKGRQSGVARLRPGRYAYRVRCLPESRGAPPLAEGTIRIERDSGRRQLPRKAPAVNVDADGRRYTVRYQNRVPQITLRWPDPPPSERYTLELSTQRGPTKKQTLTKPSARFGSGALGEGTHSFRFATSDGKHVAEGSVRIDFDNATTTAYLSAPADGSVIPGRSTTVSGAALSRSSVRVGATEVPVDAHGRFSTDVVLDGDSDAIAIRVQHPATGVHYYLRRAAGSARAR